MSSDELFGVETRGKIIAAQLKHMRLETEKLEAELLELRRRYVEIKSKEIRQNGRSAVTGGAGVW